MKFKSKKYKKRINTKKRNYASLKNKKVRISRSRKYKRVAKRYYKNNTHKRNKIQNGGVIKPEHKIQEELVNNERQERFNQLLSLGIPEPAGFTLSYTKIKYKGRFTTDSLSKKSALFLVQFKAEHSLSANTLIKFFSFKMTRNDSKTFTVYFQVELNGTQSYSPVTISYVSGKPIADIYIAQKKLEEQKTKQEDPKTEQEDPKTAKSPIESIEEEMITNAKVLEFNDAEELIINLIITDDTGLSTYIFRADDNKDLFNILSNIKDWFKVTMLQ